MSELELLMLVLGCRMVVVVGDDGLVELCASGMSRADVVSLLSNVTRDLEGEQQSDLIRLSSHG